MTLANAKRRRYARARFLSILVLVALSVDAGAQTDARDALIQELRQRIEALEKKPAAPTPPAAAPSQPPSAAPAQPPAAASKPAAAAPTPTESEEAGAADEGGRALERTLVREGGLVLPRGMIEVEPRLQYTYRGSQETVLVTVPGGVQGATQDVRSNQFEASVAVRGGLPRSFQAEARLPYVWIDQNVAVAAAGVRDTERVSGWGDVELVLSKQLATERRGGLLGSVLWKTVSGQHELGRLSPGSGFHQVQAGLNVVRREDPLVFFLSPSYSWVFKRERSGVDVNPGNAIGLKAGTVLAASPDTSLRGSFEFSRTGRTRINAVDIPGSDTTIGILELGLGTLVTRRTLLDVQFGIGVTPDAPDFRLRISMPIRFGP